MHKKYLLVILYFFIGTVLLNAQAIPARRLDTTIKIGKAGYRLVCNNKNPDKNQVNITPVGFDKEVRDFGFEVKGRITKAEVDDINQDGFPDLVFYVFTNDSIPKGNVIGISSDKNESCSPIIFPDIYDDPKLRVGYKGKDEFFLMEGYLVRRFPVYNMDSTKAPAATGTLIRQVTYRVVPGDRGAAKFMAMKSYEFTRQ